MFLGKHDQMLLFCFGTKTNKQTKKNTLIKRTALFFFLKENYIEKQVHLNLMYLSSHLILKLKT